MKIQINMETPKPKTKKQISEALVLIASYVTQDMRKEWSLHNGKGMTMINEYFAGRALPHQIIGEKLLNDMLAKIEANNLANPGILVNIQRALDAAGWQLKIAA